MPQALARGVGKSHVSDCEGRGILGIGMSWRKEWNEMERE
jgi:hypothetical protein